VAPLAPPRRHVPSGNLCERDAILVARSPSKNRPYNGRFRPVHAPSREAWAIHPPACVPCEHMFPSPRTYALAQQALAAFRLTRSLLLLEDDDRVDWEVDGSAPAGARPDRAPLREGDSGGRAVRYRAGQPPSKPQVCVFAADTTVTTAGRSRYARTRRCSHLTSAERDSRCPLARGSRERLSVRSAVARRRAPRD
jgi:hypothetical protein